MSDSTNAEIMNGLLTEAVVRRLFRRGKVTIIKWRQDDGMPHIVIPGDARPAIRYRLADLKRWAKETGRTIYGRG